MRQSYQQDSMRIHAHRTHWGALEVRFACLFHDRTTRAAKPLEFVEVSDGECFDPAMVLGRTEAQQLMDELWRAGVRPTEGEGSAGQLGATERHLSDMRSIAFYKLGIKGSE